MERSHSIIEAFWISVDNPSVRLMLLTQSHNPSKSLPLLFENPRLLKNHHMIGSHEVEPSTPNLDDGNENGAPGGILKITHNLAAPVGRIFGDHVNDQDVMVELAMNPPCLMANLAWQKTKKVQPSEEAVKGQESMY
jgi:hypothetical protein